MKYKTPTSTAIIGALALLTTGCEPYRNVTSTMTNSPSMATSTLTGGPYTTSKVMVGDRNAKMALHRASGYYAQLSDRQRAMLKKRNIRYFAVEVPAYRNRGNGTPILLYDTQANQLVGKNVIYIASPLNQGNMLNINGRMAKFIGAGMPVAYP